MHDGEMSSVVCSCRFFGSRFDDIDNFGGRSIDEVAADLAAFATAVARVRYSFTVLQAKNY